MIQSEVEREVAEGAAGSACAPERVSRRPASGLWEVHLRCAGCGPFHFLVTERAHDLDVRAQVRREIARHEARH